MSNNTVTIGCIEPTIITDTSSWSRIPKVTGDEMSTMVINTERMTDEIQAFRDVSKPLNWDEASTDTKNKSKNHIGIIELPSVINIVNCIFAWNTAQPRAISSLVLTELI